MATSIHHGPPGSFKSFTLVQRFAIQALLEGRVVVTNIRGFHTIQLIHDQFPELVFPVSAKILGIDTDEKEGRVLMAGWFHWVPFGALILMDEGQRIYPDRTDFKLEKLDKFVCPEGYTPDHLSVIDSESADEKEILRPEDIFTAFDMQRHFNWDLFISTPNIKKIKMDIRESSETAYLHKSLAGKIPFLFKNTWYEFQHDPEKNGKILSDRVGKPRKYTADPRYFKCYKSTLTGKHVDSKADSNVLSDSSVRIKLFAIVLAICASGYFFVSRLSAQEAIKLDVPAITAPSTVSDKPSAQILQAAASKAIVNAPGNVPVQQASGFFDSLGYKILSVAYQSINDKTHQKLTFIVETVEGLQTVNYTALFRQGVRASVRGLCQITLISTDGIMLKLGCEHSQIKVCSARVETDYFISQRDCHKYNEPKPVEDKPVTTALNNVSILK